MDNEWLHNENSGVTAYDTKMWYENRIDPATGELMLATGTSGMEKTDRWCNNVVSCKFVDSEYTKRYTNLFTPEYFESTFELDENHDGDDATTMAFYETYG